MSGTAAPRAGLFLEATVALWGALGVMGMACMQKCLRMGNSVLEGDENLGMFARLTWLAAGKAKQARLKTETLTTTHVIFLPFTLLYYNM